MQLKQASATGLGGIIFFNSREVLAQISNAKIIFVYDDKVIN